MVTIPLAEKFCYLLSYFVNIFHLDLSDFSQGLSKFFSHVAHSNGSLLNFRPRRRSPVLIRFVTVPDSAPWPLDKRRAPLGTGQLSSPQKKSGRRHIELECAAQSSSPASRSKLGDIDKAQHRRWTDVQSVHQSKDHEGIPIPGQGTTTAEMT